MGSNSDMLVTLHGDLSITIFRARSLPNMDFVAEQFRRCFSTCVTPIPTPDANTAKHHHKHRIITSDPYVKVKLAGATVARTGVIPNSQDPVWNEVLNVPVAHNVCSVDFEVKDSDVFGADVIGAARVPAQRVRSGESITDWFPVFGANGKLHKEDTAIFVNVKFLPVDTNQIYQLGIARDPESLGVRNTYFPLRKGGMLKLYQDAHVNDWDFPKDIELEDGKVFGHGKCWEDICHAILQAQKLIYIVGWSIYDKVKLVREPTTNRLLPKAGELTLGDLLKYKSQEGVRVCLLVWDDKTSHDKFLFKKEGVMQTHDEETNKFFKHSSVICVLSPRYASGKLSIFKQQVVGTIYTHHQKCVLVDTQASEINKRKITAFIGGLDLCDGRYDTPEHRLFKDLDTVFLNDFHNGTFPTETKGPRQPWHDLHCRIEGPAVYDILTNFEQRWRKAVKWWGSCFRKVSHWHDDALIKLERISWIYSPSNSIPANHPSLWVSEEDNIENWHVQIFRSIDSGSIKEFPKTTKEAIEKNLITEKDLVIDKSIHTAYVQAIRSAKNYIYIENQYFIGSSYGWPSYKSSDAGNLIPMELALKISSKIRAGERFAVYIIIPMWPEGDPSSPTVQEILFWQSQTMQMMYEIIAKELIHAGVKGSHPQDYLNFYCLGNREVSQNYPSPSTNQLSTTALLQTFRRFMVYVHSKGMIVDDEYVILGSANINQRSLDGSRDTEIAMGAYQSHYTCDKKNGRPHGQVYGYRMSLWQEHLGMVNDLFKEPHSLKCVEKVNNIAKDNWNRFVASEQTKLQGHLLMYPLRVGSDGIVSSISGQETFPDIGGKIIGAHNSLPDVLTT
ncbi:Phospholipase D delta [Zostera marina]|uniref:Phospholipase D n=1 Tax=Zostera marina TaxID=29655 RepID=A0A0K9NP36_ZOSMR|nr:Phospholipase D delta [Zostera marina]